MSQCTTPNRSMTTPDTDAEDLARNNRVDEEYHRRLNDVVYPKFSTTLYDVCDRRQEVPKEFNKLLQNLHHVQLETLKQTPDWLKEDNSTLPKMEDGCKIGEQFQHAMKVMDEHRSQTEKLSLDEDVTKQWEDLRKARRVMDKFNSDMTKY